MLTRVDNSYILANDPAGKMKIGCKYGCLRRVGEQCGPLVRLQAGSPPSPWTPALVVWFSKGQPTLPPPPHGAAPHRLPQAGPLSRNRRGKLSQSGKPLCGCGNPIPRSGEAEKGVCWEGKWPPLTSPMSLLRSWDTGPNPLGAGTPTPATAVMQHNQNQGDLGFLHPHPKHRQWLLQGPPSRDFCDGQTTHLLRKVGWSAGHWICCETRSISSSVPSGSETEVAFHASVYQLQRQRSLSLL